MDVISTAASLVTLVQVVGGLARQGRDIISRYQNAPARLRQVTDLINILQSELTIIFHLQRDVCDTGLPLLPDDIASLSQVLQVVTVSFNKIREDLESQSKNVGKRARLRWALWDHSRSESLELRLQQDDNHLKTVLHLISVRLIRLSLYDTTSIKESQQIIIQSILAAQPALPDTSSNREVNNEKDRDDLQKTSETNGLGWWFWARSTNLEVTNSWLRVAISAYGNKFQKNYWISFRTLLPRLDTQRALFFDLRLRSYTLRPLGLLMPFANLSIRNVVSEMSPLMKACREGNCSKVVSLFDRRKGSPDDITPSGLTPLSVCLSIAPTLENNVLTLRQNAIESGSFELVQYLLMAGAQADIPFGLYQTSPLQRAFRSRKIEIARLLLANGASYEHISLRGWSPLFYLYDLNQTKSASAEYLEMTLGDCSTSINIQDSEGWTCLHRAAAFGTADDIETLLKFGAFASITTDKLEWTPHFLAVQFGNMSTLKMLLHHTDAGVIRQTDARGWTMLHVAVNTGNLETMTFLLRSGADPLALTEPAEQLLPPGLERRTLSAAQIARNKGDIAATAFVQALRAADWDVIIPLVGEDEDEIFWPAEA